MVRRLRSLDIGAYGSLGAQQYKTQLAAERPHSRINYFFGSKLGLYQQSLTARSILEHVSICSLHNAFTCVGKRTDFCTSDHHFGITHGRKTVAPSRTPCDSDPFFVAIHKSMLAFMGARTDTLQWGQISCSLLYLLLSIGSLKQFWNVITLELRASFSGRRSSLPFFLMVVWFHMACTKL